MRPDQNQCVVQCITGIQKKKFKHITVQTHSWDLFQTFPIEI